MSLTAELLKELEAKIDALEIIPAEGGRFEVSVNGEVVFSKAALKRHAMEGEILGLVRARAN